MTQERNMDGVNWLQHPQLGKADVMLEPEESTWQCVAGSLQQLALWHLWYIHVKLWCILCTPPQPQFP